MFVWYTVSILTCHLFYHKNSLPLQLIVIHKLPEPQVLSRIQQEHLPCRYIPTPSGATGPQTVSLKNEDYTRVGLRTMNGGMLRSASSLAMALLHWIWGVFASSLWTDKSTTATFCPLHMHWTAGNGTQWIRQWQWHQLGHMQVYWLKTQRYGTTCDYYHRRTQLNYHQQIQISPH